MKNWVLTTSSLGLAFALAACSSSERVDLGERASVPTVDRIVAEKNAAPIDVSDL